MSKTTEFAGIKVSLTKHEYVRKQSLIRLLRSCRVVAAWCPQEWGVGIAEKHDAPTAAGARELRRYVEANRHVTAAIVDANGPTISVYVKGAFEWSVIPAMSTHSVAAAKRKKRDLRKVTTEALPDYLALIKRVDRPLDASFESVLSHAHAEWARGDYYAEFRAAVEAAGLDLEEAECEVSHLAFMGARKAARTRGGSGRASPTRISRSLS